MNDKAIKDLSIDLIDVMHGELKNMMYECEQAMLDNEDRYLQGYMNALTECYRLTYNLIFARQDLKETQQ